jgi:hypothetical protein
MLKLLRSWLRAGIIEGGVYSDISSGTPQGSPISPLLCNIALSVLDEELTKARRQSGKLVRFADDWVVLCPTKERAETARSIAETVLATLGLRLHPDKTRIVNLTKGAEGFDFLGFHNRMCESEKWPGRYYLLKWPSDRAMASIKAKVREMTHRRFVGSSLDAVVDRLNPFFGDGRLLPTWKLIEEVRHGRQLRPPTDGDPGQQQARSFRAQLGHPVQLRVVHEPRDLPADWDGGRTGLRMHWGERCRKAVCRRTACTV